ncbi:MAG: cytochrome c biogenesis protein CcdA [Sphingomonadales bacterium]|nr:cytochrome c biogenesis protein CcdA [Sphingomonadales bacterium]NCT05004.1 cytochrome c biogenesis protein CcdA [Sphingomonadales bacterium]
MGGEYALAFVAGLVTILNPCVLPLIPILVASSLGKHRHGPLALATGLGLSFTIFGFIVIAFGFQLGIDERGIRMFAGAVLLIAGLVLLIPRAQAALTAFAAPLTNRANQALGKVSGDGLGGQFLVGLLLGLVWTPCVGPTLGAAIAAASQGEDLFQAFTVFLTFAIGVGISIVLFAYASRKAVGWNGKRLQSVARYAKPVFGIVLVLVGLLVLTGLDKQLEAFILDLLPDWLVAFTTRF